MAQQSVEEEKAAGKKVGLEGVPGTKLLLWREGKKAPCPLRRGTCAILNDKIVYFNYVQHLCGYDLEKNSWFRLPDYQYSGYSLVVLNGMLTAVGGHENWNTYTGKVLSLSAGKGQHQEWTEVFPPMPTKRAHASVVLSGVNLIVAGGKVGRQGEAPSVVVEVMNISTRKWTTAASLPASLWYASAAICGDYIYIVSGVDQEAAHSSSMYTCSLTALCQSASRSRSLGARFKKLVLRDQPGTVWSRIDNLPFTQSTCISLNGRLLAIGGNDLDIENTTAVHMYSPTTKSWEVVSRMSIGRRVCLATVLPDNQVMAVGGFTESFSHDDSVEFGFIE